MILSQICFNMIDIMSLASTEEHNNDEKNILNLKISTKLTSGLPEIRLRTEGNNMNYKILQLFIRN